MTASAATGLAVSDVAAAELDEIVGKIFAAVAGPARAPDATAQSQCYAQPKGERRIVGWPPGALRAKAVANWHGRRLGGSGWRLQTYLPRQAVT
jgi:hypothetical protein